VSLKVLDWFKESFSGNFQIHYLLLTVWNCELTKILFPSSIQTHFNRCGIIHPFSPDLTFKFRQLIMKIYSLKEGDSETIQAIRLPWNSTQILAAVKAFKLSILGPSYSDELHYKLFKNISVEIHPFIRLYSQHLYQSFLIHQLAANLMISSEKSPFDDFIIFVLLFEEKKLGYSSKYLALMLLTVTEKGMIKPFDARQILQAINNDNSSKQRKRILSILAELLVLRKGLIHEQEASLDGQIEACVKNLTALLNYQRNKN